MNLFDVVREVRRLLEENGRVSQRMVRSQFGLDDDALAEVVEELIDVQRIAVREGSVLVQIDPHVSGKTVNTAATLPPGTASIVREPGAYTPKHLADRILQSRSALEGERKQVTVLFADVKGSMDLAAQLDPEEWHQILERFFAILTGGVHRFEGTVNQYTGDGIMALFGAPLAHEDHAQRACYAALQMGETLRSFARELRRTHGLDFSTRMGLNSGDVIVGRIGDDLRMDYTAQGHTVGLAQRMESLAEPNTCFMTDTTAALVSGYFALDDLGEFTLKGASMPVRVHQLTGLGHARSRFDISRARGLSRFVGREADMQTLEAALEQSRAGNGQVIGIVAEAGTGKSRLCFEFLERCKAKGLTVQVGRALAHGKNVPLVPMLEVLRASFGIVEGDPDRLTRDRIAGRLLQMDDQFRDLLPVVFEFFGVADSSQPTPRIDAESREQYLFAVLRSLVREHHIDGQPVTLIEDLHWIDQASDRFVEQWVDAVAGSDALLILNFRPEYRAGWMNRSWYRQIPLTPLGTDAVRLLLANLLGRDPSIEGLAGTIHQRGGGNPFFTEEIVRNLIETGALQGTEGHYRLEVPVAGLQVPDTVQALLAARIDRLSDTEKQVLQAAAVIGKDFHAPVIEQVLEELEGAPLPAALLRSGLQKLKDAEFILERSLYPVPEYTFRHPLTQEVALHSQLQAHRRKTHAAVAKALTRFNAERLDEGATMIALHWDEAGDIEQAVRWYQRAAMWSGLNDTRAALHQWLRVKTLAGTLPDSPWADEMTVLACSGALLLGGYRVEDSTLDWSRIYADGCSAAERLGDLSSLARMQSTYARAGGMMGSLAFDTVVRHARDAVVTADRLGDVALRCGTRTTLCHAAMFWGQLDEAARAAQEMIDIAGDDVDIGAEVIGYSPLIWARMFLEIHRGYTIDPVAAVNGMPRLRRLAIDRGYPEMILWSAPHEAKFLRALQRKDDLRALAGAVADVLRTPGGRADTNRVFASEVLFLLHASNLDWLAALDEATLALGLIRDKGANRPYEPQVLANIAIARLELGDLKAARAAAIDGIGCILTSDVILQPGAYAALARIQLALDEPAADIAATLDEYAAVLARAGLNLCQRELSELRTGLATRKNRPAT